MMKDNGEKSRPPYTCLPSWMGKFFDVARQTRLDKIDKTFIASNIIASNHESKVLVALRFLNLISEDGNPTEKLNSLKMVGEGFKTNLADIVNSAYRDMFDTVAVNIAKPENIINYFTQRFNYTTNQAANATKFLAWLATRAGINISPELGEYAGKTVGSHEDKRNGNHTSKRYRMVKNGTDLDEEASMIRAVINISLDSNTPMEIWNRVLRLLGEKQPPPDQTSN